jgi:catechol 2,3-dioxygenase-like lactoylglutathione lyase family enzyme
METVPIQGIEEIVIEVSDLDRAVAFYQDVIGLRLYSRGSEEAWFRAGDQWLAVFLKGRGGAIGPHFAFRVAEEDVERARHAMAAYGMAVHTGEYSGGPSVYICDPDGNRIELHGKRDAA